MKNRFIFFCTALLLACIPFKGWAAGAETVIAGSIDGIARGRLLMIVRTGEAKLDTLARVDFKGSRFVLNRWLPRWPWKVIPVGSSCLLNPVFATKRHCQMAAIVMSKVGVCRLRIWIMPMLFVNAKPKLSRCRSVMMA